MAGYKNHRRPRQKRTFNDASPTEFPESEADEKTFFNDRDDNPTGEGENFGGTLDSNEANSSLTEDQASFWRQRTTTEKSKGHLFTSLKYIIPIAIGIALALWALYLTNLIAPLAVISSGISDMKQSLENIENNLATLDAKFNIQPQTPEQTSPAKSSQ